MNKPTNTKNWQISVNDPTVILEDVEDIAQAIFLILSTIKGSDPLRPEFGSDIYTWLDQPMNMVQPMLVYEVFSAVEMWEPRVKLTNVRLINWEYDKKNVEIKGYITAQAAQVDMIINL